MKASSGAATRHGVLRWSSTEGWGQAVWFSVGSDLADDACRDLRDIGASAIPMCRLQNLGGPFDTGVMFCTYSLLIAKAQAGVPTLKTSYSCSRSCASARVSRLAIDVLASLL